jgi:DNA-binding PadR family transcriptional regulator
VSRGALYATLERLERKGCVRWALEKGGPERGGHPRRKFLLTRTGLAALREYRRAVQSLVLGFEERL